MKYCGECGKPYWQRDELVETRRERDALQDRITAALAYLAKHPHYRLPKVISDLTASNEDLVEILREGNGPSTSEGDRAGSEA